MEHPSLTFIMRTPDGSVSLLTQPHMSNKRYLQCKNCPASIVYTRGERQVYCSKCLKKSKAPKEKSYSTELECPSCTAEMNINWVGGIIYRVCTGCNRILTV